MKSWVKSGQSRAVFSVAALLAVAVSPASAGPVTVLSQDRSIHVAIPSIDDNVADVNETVTSPDNSPFVATLDHTLSQQGQTNHALASQDSSFGNAGNVFSVSANGQTRYSATGLAGIVFSDSAFEVQFSLAEARSYSINGSGSFLDSSGGATNFTVTLTGPGGTVASFAKSNFNPGNEDGAVVTPSFAKSGSLTAGTYTLSAVSGVSGGTNSNEVPASFDFDFTATAAGGGEGGNPVPLPAAVGPAGVLLATMAGASALRRRRIAVTN